MTYGTDVINWSEADVEGRTDPMIDVFPRVTKCSFHKYGPTGKHSRFEWNFHSTSWLRLSGLIENFTMTFSELFSLRPPLKVVILDLEHIFLFGLHYTDIDFLLNL